MLQDELGILRDLIRDLTQAGEGPGVYTIVKPSESLSAVRIACDDIRVSWLKAFFSDAGDQALKRYFYFHQEGIREISDALLLFAQSAVGEPEEKNNLSLINRAVCSLITHLQHHHAAFFDAGLNSPLYWRREALQRYAPNLAALAELAVAATIDEQFKACLVSYLAEGQNAVAGGFYSFEGMSYLETLVARLVALSVGESFTEAILDAVLLELDFNRLDYFLCLCKRISARRTGLNGFAEQLSYLRERKSAMLLSAHSASAKCRPEFPSLTVMLEEWFDEEIRRTVQGHPASGTGITSPVKKIVLNLSVAQIACLIRVLYACHVISDNSLTGIFQFIATHFSSKRQEHISEGSLSKEYYSISQSTAHKVLALLQQFIDHLRNGFFPLLAVISVVSGIS